MKYVLFAAALVAAGSASGAGAIGTAAAGDGPLADAAAETILASIAHERAAIPLSLDSVHGSAFGVVPGRADGSMNTGGSGLALLGGSFLGGPESDGPGPGPGFVEIDIELREFIEFEPSPEGVMPDETEARGGAIVPLPTGVMLGAAALGALALRRRR